MIKDSGNRTKFESGAVRDIQEGKGRCDLLPLHVISMWLGDPIFGMIEQYREKSAFDPTPKSTRMVQILSKFTDEHRNTNDTCKSKERYRYDLVLEVAKHFEEGAKKYGDRNWEKGIPCDRYIDSAVRHYCKWRAGWTDEPHDRAFIWNIVCCEWTRQRYGWNLERLKKDEHDKAKSGLQCNWANMPNYVFKKESESKEFVKISEQLAKGVRASMEYMNRLAAAISESPLTIHVKKEDIRNEDILRQINDQETATLKEACAIIERDNVCFDSPTEVCCTKLCNDCEHYIDPDITHNAVNRLLDHAKKSLENTEAE